MRVANLYDDIRRVGRNDGASMYLTHNLRKMGHEVVHLIPDPKKLSGFGKFDMSFWVDWGADALREVLDYDPIYSLDAPVRICWLSDTHLGYADRLNVARHFQGEGGFVFCMQKRAVEEMSHDGISNPIWLPHAVDLAAYPKIEIVKKYSICFVGHLNSIDRVDFLDRMFKEFTEDFFFGKRLFEEAARIYRQSKIVLNPPIKDDLNMRVFETLGTGSFLLTKDIPSIHDLFVDGKHLVLYKDVEDAIEKARYYISHDEERERIAESGYQEAISKHTYKHRIEEILRRVGIQREEAVLCQQS